jgi:Protein of unknown function (DUF1638)
MNKKPKPCVISCGILKREIKALVENGDIDVDLKFLSDRLHYDYNRLEKGLSGAIEKRLPDCPGGIVVVYGDVCLGFQNEMKTLIDRYDVVKVDALNCIDCLLGGRGELLKIDPDHIYLFLNPAFIHFSQALTSKSKEETRDMFSMLKGIILIDSLGNLDDFQKDIDRISDKTGLPIIERRQVGLDGIKKVLQEAIARVGAKDSSSL